ncbi:MAG TPA: hypothetical protein VMR21_14575, partial [Vicinamibacteria bacterium]|nr:hypothetical protein [Vicinamibacteria bacterium]
MTLGSDRRWIVTGTGALALLAVWASLARLEEPRPASGGGAPAGIGLGFDEEEEIPEEQWTARFRARIQAGDWAGLDRDLDGIQEREPDLYRRYHLGYTHARAKIGYGELDDGREALKPFLAPGHFLRDLALYHDAEAAEADEEPEEAAQGRQTLVLEFPKATHRDTALEKLLSYLSERGDPQALRDLAGKLGGTVDASVQRDLESRILAARAAKGDEGALPDLLRFLRGSKLGDDAAERVARGIDRPEWIDRLSADDLVLVGEALRTARHFDRAVELLRRALPLLPAKRDDVLFAIGRADFGRERYADAEATYLEGTKTARDGETRASFYYQASRAAQLVGDDQRAEEHLAKAVAAGGRTTRASAAHTQRLRIRMKQGRYDQAGADLRAVQSRFGKSHAVVEATLAYAIGMIAAGRPQAASRELQRLSAKLIDAKQAPEIVYWKARALEGRDPRRAARMYLEVMRADTPTHFAFFAKRRLASEPLASRARAEIESREAQVERALQAEKLEEARRLQTDVVLLAPMEEEVAEIEKLAAIYRRMDAYRSVLEMPAPEYPRFPLFPPEGEEPGRLDLLLAAGLFDD